MTSSDSNPDKIGNVGSGPGSVDKRLAASEVQTARTYRNVRFMVLLYLFFAGWWILFTDRILGSFVHSMREHEEWSIYKGYVFVFVTGLLLFLFARRMALEFNRISDSLRVSEKKYRDLVDHSPDAIYINRRGRITFLNVTALRIFGATDESQILGKTPWELYHPDCHQIVAERIRALQEGKPVPLASQKIVRLDGQVLDVEVAAVALVDDQGPGALIILREITQRIEQEAEIRRLTRLYAVLSQINQVIIRVGSRDELFREVCRIVIEDGGFRLAWMGRVCPGTHEVVKVAGAGEGVEALEQFKIYDLGDRPEGCGIIGTSIRTGKAVAANDYASDPRTRPWWGAAVRLGVQSAISLPVRNAGTVCAALVVFSSERDCFRNQELSLLEEIALDISFALDHMDQEALRREAQLAFQKSEEQLRLLIDHLQAGVMVYSAENQIIMANPQAARLLGASKEELVGNIAAPGWHFTDEKGRPLAPGEYPVARVIATHGSLDEHVLGIEHGGEGVKTWLLVNAYPEFDNGEVLRHVVVTFADLTERTRMVEALTESEEKFRLLFEASRDAIVLIDGEKHLGGNSAALELFGFASGSEFSETRLGDFSPECQPDGVPSVEAFKSHVANGFGKGATPFEWVMRRRDGTLFSSEVSLSRFELRGRRILQAVIRDISWRKETEKHLRQLSRAVEQSPSSVVITDTQGNIEYVNPKFTAITGYSFEEALGQNPRLLKSGESGPGEYQELWETITVGKEWRGTFHNKKKDGELFWESASISPITDESGAITHFLAIKEDITDRKQMEEKILRAQRMESIGSLAGGMAHDLNNILAPIMMSASMLKEEGISAEMRAQLVAGIEEAVQRGADIVGQVLTFARGAKGKHIALNVQSLVKQVGQFVKETFPKSIGFSEKLLETPWNVSGDPTQLYQVLLNLCVNARDAMPEGGTLRLEVENCELGAHPALAPEARPGRYVKITVADTGTGIAKEIADRIFEPFFTTKEPGKGTGLGLSTVIGILRSHRGFVTVDSAPALGAEFGVYLPVTTEAIVDGDHPVVSNITRGHGETILIVDDEPDILWILKMVLQQNGWTAVCAPDGVEGLAAYLNGQEKIKAVLTDMIMPNMDGLSLIRAIRKLDPHLPIFVASGYGDESSVEELNRLGVSGFLKKPFNARMIQAKLAKALYG